MQVKLRFGPAGMPLALKGKTLSEGIEYTASIGLHAFEIEYVRGVRLKREEGIKAKQAAEKNDVLLSCHAPYYINCCSPIKIKQQIAIRNIIQTARAAEILGARIIVFHPGYYQTQSKEQAMKNCISVLKQALQKMKSEKLHTRLGTELTGKPSAFGSLEEIIELAKKIDIYPVIDFAHHHARNNGCIKERGDYEKIFAEIKKGLGSEYLKGLHCHFSELVYTEKGERFHIPIFTKNSPNLKWLAEIIKSRRYKFTMISESPMLEKDALKMQKACI